MARTQSEGANHSASQKPILPGLRRIVALNLDTSSPWEEWVQLAEMHPVMDLSVEIHAGNLPPSGEELLRAGEKLQALRGKSCLHIVGERALARFLQGDFDSLLAPARLVLLDAALSEGEARQASLKCRRLICESAQLSLLDKSGPSVERTSWIQKFTGESPDASEAVQQAGQSAGRAFRIDWAAERADSDLMALAAAADATTVALVGAEGRRLTIGDCYGIARTFARVKGAGYRGKAPRVTSRDQVTWP